KNEDFILEKIPIKSHSRRANLSQVRGRIIGTKRRALDQLEGLTNCQIILHDNTLGIIGDIQDVKKASFALKKLIRGSNHSKVY
ncbi:KH domain-containing protein, partial [Klebsiella pneumoniae]|uniref:KH domain-containing protein n=1 Tax=Klebsiella pneumoniae TaxID=573 RepID=UPI0025A0C2A4